jgi:hypothetical protein
MALLEKPKTNMAEKEFVEKELSQLLETTLRLEDELNSLTINA